MLWWTYAASTSCVPLFQWRSQQSPLMTTIDSSDGSSQYAMPCHGQWWWLNDDPRARSGCHGRYVLCLCLRHRENHICKYFHVIWHVWLLCDHVCDHTVAKIVANTPSTGTMKVYTVWVAPCQFQTPSVWDTKQVHSGNATSFVSWRRCEKLIQRNEHEWRPSCVASWVVTQKRTGLTRLKKRHKRWNKT